MEFTIFQYIGKLRSFLKNYKLALHFEHVEKIHEFSLRVRA